MAHLHRAAGQPAPWQALSQILLLGCVRADGSEYRTMPDVLVYRRPIDQQRGSVALEVDGPPVLIVEVLSESTYRADLDPERGKGYSHARAGVREYLAIDPTRVMLEEGKRGWRLDEGRYQPWEPDGQGRWRSAEIAVAFGLEGTLATVYTAEGRRLLHEGEVEAALERERRLRAEELTGYAAELERLRRLLDERQQS